MGATPGLSHVGCAALAGAHEAASTDNVLSAIDTAPAM